MSPITLGTKFIILNMVFKSVHQPHFMSFSLSILTFLPAQSFFISSKMPIFFSCLKYFMHGVSIALVSSEKKCHIHLSDFTLNVTCSHGSHITTQQCIVLLFFFSFFHKHAYRKVHIPKEQRSINFQSLKNKHGTNTYIKKQKLS